MLSLLECLKCTKVSWCRSWPKKKKKKKKNLRTFEPSSSGARVTLRSDVGTRRHLPANELKKE